MGDVYRAAAWAVAERVHRGLGQDTLRGPVAGSDPNSQRDLFVAGIDTRNGVTLVDNLGALMRLRRH